MQNDDVLKKVFEWKTENGKGKQFKFFYELATFIISIDEDKRACFQASCEEDKKLFAELINDLSEMLKNVENWKQIKNRNYEKV